MHNHWALDKHKLGHTTYAHFPDGTAHKNRMQGNDYVQSKMYEKGITCATCHDSHGSEHYAMLRKPAQQLCLDCHTPGSPSGPQSPTIEAHTHHKPDSAGSQCISCHMPEIAQTLGDVKVRSHTFRWVSPAKTVNDSVPNACNTCHTDKPVEWTIEEMKKWKSTSPWRVEN